MSTSIRSVRGPQMETSENGRIYVWAGERYRSVTTLISAGLPKPAIVGWGMRTVAEAAVRDHELVGRMIATRGEEGAIDDLKRAPYREREKKGKLGTEIHAIAEAYVLGAPYPTPTEEQAGYVRGFEQWLADFSPTFLAVEAPVLSKRNRYAGTLDAIVEISHPSLAKIKGLPVDRPLRILTDYKTGSSGIYPETGLQLSAYRYGESYIRLPDSGEEPLPEVDLCAAVWLRPDGYQFVPVRADEEVFRSFLYVREVARFLEEISPGVVGRAILPEA